MTSGIDAQRRIQVGPVVLGVIADKVAFVVATALLAALVPTTSSAFSVLALILGFACTTLGAFVAAVRARHRPVQHGLLVALAGFIISFVRFAVFSLNPPSDPGAIHSLAWELFGWALVFLAGFFGGSLGRRYVTPAA